MHALQSLYRVCHFIQPLILNTTPQTASSPTGSKAAAAAGKRLVVVLDMDECDNTETILTLVIGPFTLASAVFLIMRSPIIYIEPFKSEHYAV